MQLGLASNFQDEVDNIEPIWNLFKGVVDLWTVVDSGSTDGTQDKLKSQVGDKLNLIEDPMIKVHGYGYSRTKLIELSTSMDWVLIIDGDERMLPEEIGQLRPLIESHEDTDLILLPRCHYQNWEMTEVEYGNMETTGPDWHEALRINPDWQPRLFKRTITDGRSKIQFTKCVHEWPTGMEKEFKDISSPCIRHFGYLKSPERLKMVNDLCIQLRERLNERERNPLPLGMGSSEHPEGL